MTAPPQQAPDLDEPIPDLADVISSADDILITDTEPEPEPEPGPPARRARPRKTPRDDTAGDSKPRAGPPTLDEWHDFFSRRVIKGLSGLYIDAAFRGIDEDWLSESEIDRIQLSDDERDRIARPFAELANKTGFLRRNGRILIAAGGVSDSLIALGIWTRRVNRIARKYRNRTVRANVSPGQGEPQPNPNGNGAGSYVTGQYYSPGA